MKYIMYIRIRNKNNSIMTLTQITKQIEKLETKISKLSRELHRTMNPEIEKKLNKQREILFHLEKIQGLLI